MADRITLSTDTNSLIPCYVKRFFQEVDAKFQRGDNLERDLDGGIETDYICQDGTILTYTRDNRDAWLYATGSEKGVKAIAEKFKEKAKEKR